MSIKLEQEEYVNILSDIYRYVWGAEPPTYFPTLCESVLLYLERSHCTSDLELCKREGGEGMGVYACTTLRWNHKYYTFVYNYSSYGGYDFDYMSVYEVKPVTKTITVYE